jgi:Tfp pilus assembly protein PilV
VTLVELMVVLVVVGVGILALSGVQTRSSTDVYSTGRRTRAIEVAQTQMEVARSLGYTLAAPDSGQTDLFNWRTDVDSVDVSGVPLPIGLHRLTVTVSWTESNTPDSVRFYNLVSDR